MRRSAIAGGLLVVLGAAPAVRGQVPYQRIVAADREPGQWLSYSRTYDGQRFSPLAEITAENVRRLRPTWIFQSSSPGEFETTPLAVDGVL